MKKENEKGKRVLVVYGTRYGSTTGVAKKIIEKATELGFDTELVNLKANKEANWPKIMEYDGVIIGSGIKVGQWTKDVQNFVKRNREQINSHPHLALYTVSGFGSGEKTREKAINEGIIANMEKFGLDVSKIGYVAFGGVFDLTKKSSFGFFDKLIVKLIGKDDPMIEKGKKTDYRDWDRITKFTTDFLKQLQE